MSLLVGSRVSRRALPMESTTRPMPRFDRSARWKGGGQPVRLGDGQHVALAHEGETLGELHPLGGAGNLFAELGLAPTAVRSRSCEASRTGQWGMDTHIQQISIDLRRPRPNLKRDTTIGA